MRTVLALAIGVALAVIVVACGGTKGASRGASEPPTSVESQGMPAGDRRAELDQLDADINANLARLQLDEPPEWTALSASDPRPMTEIKSVCTPPARPSQTCGDICNLSSHICDNAERICVIADELQPDEYARGKCENGKQSCEAGRKKCCECL